MVKIVFHANNNTLKPRRDHAFLSKEINTHSALLRQNSLSKDPKDFSGCWGSKTKTKTYNNFIKKKKYQLILCRDIHNQRILQSDWIRGTPGHTQQKVVVSDATFP